MESNDGKNKMYTVVLSELLRVCMKMTVWVPSNWRYSMILWYTSKAGDEGSEFLSATGSALVQFSESPPGNGRIEISWEMACSSSLPMSCLQTVCFNHQVIHHSCSSKTPHPCSVGFGWGIPFYLSSSAHLSTHYRQHVGAGLRWVWWAWVPHVSNRLPTAPEDRIEALKETEESQNHRITKVGKDLQDHPIQLSTYHQYFPTDPCPLVQYLIISWAPPGTVTQPPPWAAHSSTWPLLWRSFS